MSADAREYPAALLVSFTVISSLKYAAPSTTARIRNVSGPSVDASAAAEYCTFIEVAALPLTVQLLVSSAPSLDPEILIPAKGDHTSKATILPLAFVALKVV